MKVKRYILPAKPERTVVRMPLFGSSTLLASLTRAIRSESIPRSAKLSIVRDAKGNKSLRAEFPTV